MKADLKKPEGLKDEKIKYKVNQKFKQVDWESSDKKLLFKIDLTNGIHTGEDETFTMDRYKGKTIDKDGNKVDCDAK